MHGLKHSITFTKIVAIDLGKFNSVVCPYDPATTQHSFLTIQTTPQAIHDLLSRPGGRCGSLKRTGREQDRTTKRGTM